jgi:hypothetical protein
MSLTREQFHHKINTIEEFAKLCVSSNYEVDLDILRKQFPHKVTWWYYYDTHRKSCLFFDRNSNKYIDSTTNGIESYDKDFIQCLIQNDHLRPTGKRWFVLDHISRLFNNMYSYK